MKALLRLSGWIDAVNDQVGRLVSWLVLLMTLLGVYNAVTRKLSRAIGMDLSSNAYIEAQWYMFSLVFLWAAGYALRHGVHVRVDLFYGRASPRTQAWIDILGTALFLIPFCLLLLWVSVPYAWESWAILEQSADPGGLPRYWIKSAIPVTGVLLLAQAVSELVRNIAFLRGHLSAEELEEHGEGGL
ncbi:TRAP transporter small permease subunit [Inmirania thermothiophila]|uniref:TRAP transporter small permease protein n=1 Tax=Inmirania thermothiophila TaxID=1750597 RepID=A0A3N1Y694_9GAMM|nr:TRAP transporter small permease subunit [Inmirania thermothiophila]ROR34305.1 TRAP-type mannitol/chloroaromatic compound transport system permease small subunit [Inmirania thermothiophila]